MNLIFPAAVLQQHLAVLGKTGAGKSSALRYIVEHLLDQGKRICVIDPKGDWAGLKVGADGKSPGYPVIGFGDFKNPEGSDVPINAQSGKHVAELVATGNRPCIIGFRGWMTNHMVRFWIDFASTLFNANAGELYLVGDEFHNFAPKGKIMDPEAGKCLHWSNRLMSEGRGYGLVCLIASQRPQKVHNDTLTCCETLVAMRVTHAADRNAVKDWIEGCGDMEKGKEVLAGLAGMKRGEAYVWSPEIGFGPQQLTFPMFRTFDSFAPPQLQVKVSTAGWATVDLDAVKQKLATVIEEHKANDPAELKRQIADLKKQIASRSNTPAAPAAPKPPKEIYVVKEADLKRFESTVGRLAQLGTNLVDQATQIGTNIARTTPARPVPPVVRPQPVGAIASVAKAAPAPRPLPAQARAPRSVDVLAQSLGRGEKKILTAIAQHERCPREQITVLAGYKRSSRDTYLRRLAQDGYVTVDSDHFTVTEEGLAALGPDFEPLPTGLALQQHWLNTLSGGEQVILAQVLAAWPSAIAREKLSEQTGYQRSSRDTYLQRLNARKLIVLSGRGEVSASPQLFD